MEVTLERASAPPPATAPETLVRPVPVEAPEPLGEADYAAVRQAVRLRRPVLRAARVARSSAIVALVIAFGALPWLLFWPSLLDLFIVAAVGAAGLVELVGYGRMRRGGASAAGLLAKNQLALLAAIALYAVARMIAFSTEEVKLSVLSPEVRAQLSTMPSIAAAIDADVERFAPILVYGFYGTVIAVTILVQGGMALYYATRRQRIETFRRAMPPWIRRLFAEIDG